MLEEWDAFFRRAQFEVIHPHNDVEANQIGPFVQSLCQVADGRIVLEQALVSETQVDLGLEQVWV